MPVTGRRGLALVVAVLTGLAVGVVVVTAIGLAAGTGRLAGPSDETKALVVLRADGLDLDQLIAEFQNADRLDDMHACAERAHQLAERVRQRAVALAALDDEAVQRKAGRAHAAAHAVFAAFADLDRVSAKDLDAWDESERDAVEALGELDAAAASVAALDPERPLLLSSRRIEPMVERASAYLTNAAGRLARYEKRMASFRRKNRRKLQTAADYKTTVLAQLAAYRGTRRELQGYLDDAKAFNERIPEFREELRDAKSRRQGIRSTLATLTPPTDSLQDEHQRLLSLLDHAISATDLGVDLADATQDLRDAYDFETSGFDLPEYREFVSQSAQITAERDSAVGAWTSAVDAHMRRLRNPKGSPKRPVI